MMMMMSSVLTIVSVFTSPLSDYDWGLCSKSAVRLQLDCGQLLHACELLPRSPQTDPAALQKACECTTENATLPASWCFSHSSLLLSLYSTNTSWSCLRPSHCCAIRRPNPASMTCCQVRAGTASAGVTGEFKKIKDVNLFSSGTDSRICFFFV